MVNCHVILKFATVYLWSQFILTRL